jgi:PAS domain S-box-containing protein
MSPPPSPFEPVSDADRSSLLLRIAGHILESRSTVGQLSLDVFEMIKAALALDLLFNYRFEDPNVLRLVASQGVPADKRVAASQLELGQALCGVAAGDRNAVIADAERIDTDPAAGFVGALGARAYACHPLLGRDGRLLGTFSVASNRRERFVPAEVDFLQTVSHFLVMAWDRQEAERNVAYVTADSERRRRLYETILSNTPDLAYVFDLEHRFVYANEVLLKMWGKTWDEAIGKSFIELGYEPGHAEMHDREIEHVKASKQPIRGEVPFDGAFGRRTYDYIFVPVLGPDGEVEAIAGTTRDITERKRAEEELTALLASEQTRAAENARLNELLTEQDRRKDEFLATLAHELRNPLAPIRTGLSIMAMSPPPETMARMRDIMARQVEHMVRLIDDLLDVARITTGKMQLQRQPVDLREVVQMALDASRPQIEAGRHRLDVALPSQAVKVDADATRIAQVVSNLLHNAAKYTPHQGRITLSLSLEGPQAVIRVADNGVGIAPEQLGSVFDLFTQIGRTIERAQGGLGIGLALVKRVVDMHGGTVEAQSVGVGEGATFTVKLGLMARDATEDTASADGQCADAAASQRRILVVDDNVDAAETLATLLSLGGHAIDMVHDGLAGLRMALDKRPDLAFIDIGLPGMNGYELARQLRTRDDMRDMVLVAVTGWGNAQDRRTALHAGFDHHLTKPVNASDIDALLSEIRGGGASDFTASKPT